MSVKNTLTNEKLNERFDSPFSLVTSAIKLAKMKIHRGEEIESNLANEVLEMIVKKQDIAYLESEEKEPIEL